MLLIPQIDIKTGKILTETSAEGMTQPRQKEISNSYLEHWLTHHEMGQPQFWVGKFHSAQESYNASDQQRLEAEGKYLIFANGKNGYFADAETASHFADAEKSGYFTDAETAKVLTEGDAERKIQPLFSNDQNTPHYSVAYGSLIASPGMASAAVGNAKILVVDDEQRSHGNTSLIDTQGRTISPTQVEKLYDKIGDGTMLISSGLMAQLIQPQEREAIAQSVFE